MIPIKFLSNFTKIKFLLFNFNKKKINLFNFIIIFTIFFFLIFYLDLLSNNVLCQDNANINQNESYINQMSDAHFNRWLRNSCQLADHLNLNFVQHRRSYILNIEENILYLNAINNIQFNREILNIFNNIVRNVDFLITGQDASKIFFLNITMTPQHQLMPLDMYIDSLTNLVEKYNTDSFLTNHIIEIGERINNVQLNENILRLNDSRNIMLNNIVELQNHTNNLDLDRLYRD